MLNARTGRRCDRYRIFYRFAFLSFVALWIATPLHCQAATTVEAIAGWDMYSVTSYQAPGILGKNPIDASNAAWGYSGTVTRPLDVWGSTPVWTASPYVLAGSSGEIAYNVFAGTTAAVLGKWNPQFGHLFAMTSGHHVSARVPVGAPAVAFSAESQCNVSLVLKFDELVQLTYWWDVGNTGRSKLSSSTPGAVGADSGHGSWTFITSEVRLTINNSTAGTIVVDGLPESALIPSFDLHLESPETAVLAWAITAVDEPVPPRAPVAAFMPIVTHRVDPMTGFDPVPVGSQSGYAGPGITYVGLQTKATIGDLLGMIPTSYSISTGDVAVTAFTAPDVIPEGSNLTVSFGQQSHAIQAGETIDFGVAGISEFRIDGFNPINASFEIDAFVIGLQFVAEGVTTIEARVSDFIAASDANYDGMVDTDDLAIWKANVGATELVTHGQGDANGDNVVDGADFLVWQRQFQDQAMSHAVPEPAGLLLVPVGLWRFILSRRRRAPGGGAVT